MVFLQALERLAGLLVLFVGLSQGRQPCSEGDDGLSEGVQLFFGSLPFLRGLDELLAQDLHVMGELGGPSILGLILQQRVQARVGFAQRGELRLKRFLTLAKLRNGLQQVGVDLL